MSEDFDYIPFKYDWHKNKNTLRYKHFHYASCKNNILECSRNLNKAEIPVTIIDEYFDDNFINSTNVYSNYQSKPLNKDYLWTNVEKSLEEASIQTIKNGALIMELFLGLLIFPLKTIFLRIILYKKNWLG